MMLRCFHPLCPASHSRVTEVKPSGSGMGKIATSIRAPSPLATMSSQPVGPLLLYAIASNPQGNTKILNQPTESQPTFLPYVHGAGAVAACKLAPSRLRSAAKSGNKTQAFSTASQCAWLRWRKPQSAVKVVPRSEQTRRYERGTRPSQFSGPPSKIGLVLHRLAQRRYSA